jgi:DNA-binding transcriptional LysR family regulator
MISSALFPSVLRVFRERYPLIALTVIECGSRRMSQAVAGGELELGMMVEPCDQNLFEARRVFSSQIGVAVRTDSDWAAHDGIAISELSHENFLLPTEDFLLPDIIRAHCREAGFTPNEVGHSAQWDLLQTMVETGMGVAVLPFEVCRLFDPAKVRVVPVANPSIPFHLALGWRRGGQLSFAARAWIDTSVEVLSQIRSGCGAL